MDLDDSATDPSQLSTTSVSLPPLENGTISPTIINDGIIAKTNEAVVLINLFLPLIIE